MHTFSLRPSVRKQQLSPTPSPHDETKSPENLSYFNFVELLIVVTILVDYEY